MFTWQLRHPNGKMAVEIDGAAIGKKSAIVVECKTTIDKASAIQVLAAMAMIK